ncbi:hypothetical protein JDV09_11160 [Mycobacterium sp. Y57]|uniref:LppA family lipoprotein n=1 Tax=Mycolicibacterium xanthum TaxID=2796469 RepID=UPI001C852749|nr:hypothetical protein [Mycolicibacterium xanthum]
MVRDEAAEYGAAEESSSFNEQQRRDHDVGGGYEFTLDQAEVDTLNITGKCFLMQSVADLPPVAGAGLNLRRREPTGSAVHPPHRARFSANLAGMLIAMPAHGG